MPGPIIQKSPRFDVANLASKLPEPFRKPAGAVMGGLMSLLGDEDDPLGGLSPTPLGPAAPLVTRFVKGGVPDKALRESYTQRFIDSARQFLKPGDVELAERVAKTHPRVAAHTKLGVLTPDKKGNPLESARTMPSPADTAPIPGSEHRSGRIPVLADPNVDWTTAGESLVHELGHVAQNLGNKDADLLYNMASAITGYSNNPFEASARRIATRKLADYADTLPNERAQAIASKIGVDRPEVFPPTTKLIAGKVQYPPLPVNRHLRSIVQDPIRTAERTVQRDLSPSEELGAAVGGGVIDKIMNMRARGYPRIDKGGIIEDVLDGIMRNRKRLPELPFTPDWSSHKLVPSHGVDLPPVSPALVHIIEHGLPSTVRSGQVFDMAGRLAQQQPDDPNTWGNVLRLLSGDRIQK